MSNQDRIVVVAGATGRQGGAVAKQLLARGWSVRAMTRDPSKPAAQALSKKGAQLVQADLDDPGSIRSALQDAYGVFSVQDFWQHGYEGEVRQGKNLADAAKEAGVQHFVYSSVGGAERDSDVPHFDSKWEIEEHIRALGLPATILRPVMFMENLDLPDFRDAILRGTFSMALPPHRSMQFIAVDDIGFFAALAFDHPSGFIGRAFEIAGDELTMSETAQVLGRVLGRTVQFQEMPLERLRSFNEEMAVMFEWFDKEGYQADIAVLHALHPGLMSFEAWLRQAGWSGAGE